MPFLFWVEFDENVTSSHGISSNIGKSDYQNIMLINKTVVYFIVTIFYYPLLIVERSSDILNVFYW